RYEVLAADTYNIDKIGFRVRIGCDQWVTADFHDGNSRLRQTVFLIYLVERARPEHVTLLVMVIILGAIHMKDQFTLYDILDNFLIGVTETGYSNDMQAMDWLHHFEDFSSHRQVGTWRLLQLDSHNSYYPPEFIKFCDYHKIILFYFPPLCTHLPQPLDVIEAVDKATRKGCSNFDKLKFLYAIDSIHSSTFKSTTITSTFRKTRLIPFDPKIVLQKLIEHDHYLLETNQTPPPSSQSLPCTPQTIWSLKRYADALQDHPALEELSPTVMQSLQSFIKGSLMQAHSGAQVFDELENIKAVGLAWVTHQVCSRRSLQ
ncbi:hypothetical protein C7212DRAFT_182795, partial [Tuber magnatum]